VGVGGQGILTASDIVAEVGLAVGYDAKKSEVHGFSQRGGVVDSHVRWAERVGAPTAEIG
jgi:indolepyruvate ferredoxin oxidoreductase beta subunit